MANLQKLDTLQTVELAEGVEIRLRIAGPVLRIGAYGLDFLLRAVLMVLVWLVAGLMGFAVGEKVVNGLLLLSWFLLDWLYPVFFESGKHGATPGKRMLGLRVVQTSGSPITPGQALVRNFLRFLDAMPFFTYGFGVASCLATRHFQRLGDLAAGTVVVYDRLPPYPAVAAPPPLTPVPLPIGLTADETRALTLFRERSGLWSDERRMEIADHAAILSGTDGMNGVERLMAMAHWVQEKRRGR
jgi:uncharacterized RDD family membrane protein YckC